MAAFAPELFTSYGQKELFTKWLPISREHLLGTNAMGYDIFTELIYGARQTLLVGVLSSILTLILGAGIGILGSFHGWVGQIFNGLIQIFVLLPKLITLIVLATFFGSSAAHLIILIAAFSWVGTARAVRAKVLQLHTQPFIESCRILGYSRAHIAVRHILPNLSDVLLSRFLLGVNSCIMMESTSHFWVLATFTARRGGRWSILRISVARFCGGRTNICWHPACVSCCCVWHFT